MKEIDCFPDKTPELLRLMFLSNQLKRKKWHEILVFHRGHYIFLILREISTVFTYNLFQHFYFFAFFVSD